MSLRSCNPLGGATNLQRKSDQGWRELVQPAGSKMPVREHLSASLRLNVQRIAQQAFRQYFRLLHGIFPQPQEAWKPCEMEQRIRKIQGNGGNEAASRGTVQLLRLVFFELRQGARVDGKKSRIGVQRARQVIEQNRGSVGIQE